MKIKMNEGIKQALLKSINVGEVFSEGVLYGLTQSIISDDYEDLDSRSDVEIIDMFEDDYNMTNYLEWSPDRKDLFLETQAKAWGLKTLEFSIDDWVAHFTDYIEHEDGALEEYEAFLDKIDKVTKVKMLGY